MPRPAYPTELVSRTQLTDTTLALTFRVGQLPAFEAGQFISLQFEYQGETHKRSYSIASSPALLKEEGLLEIVIGLVEGGVASTCFANASPGDKFTITGPFGVLTLPAEMPERLILAGTGTGMAPYRAMLPELQKIKTMGVGIHILMGTRHRSDLFFLEEFRQLVSDASHTSFELCLSREQSLDRNAGEYPGYIQNRLPHLNLVPGKDLVYLCGNPAMIDDNIKWLTEQGFGPRQIRREKYTFSR